MPKKKSKSTPSAPPESPRKRLLWSRKKGLTVGVEVEEDIEIYHVIYRKRIGPKNTVRHDFPLAEYADAAELYERLAAQDHE